jgi:hypothetical protein
VKTHNTVSITVDGLDILVTAQLFSVNGGQCWRAGLTGISKAMRDAISSAMREAARRDARDPQVLKYRRRPTSKEMPACRVEIADKRDDSDAQETLRPDRSQDLVATVVPPNGRLPASGD